SQGPAPGKRSEEKEARGAGPKEKSIKERAGVARTKEETPKEEGEEEKPDKREISVAEPKAAPLPLPESYYGKEDEEFEEF
ncbi:MAG: hypothetical protein PQJ60_11465, partial [Spirochaetales bacterium]|nr:hypothetical protein [Spirochaetales bacterium]